MEGAGRVRRLSIWIYHGWTDAQLQVGNRSEMGVRPGDSSSHRGLERKRSETRALDPLKVETRKGSRALLAQCSGTQPRQGLRRSLCLYTSQRILLGL